MKGFFVTFEGIEGSGKSTQIKFLEAALEERGIPCLVTREPGGPPLAEAIRSLLLDTSYSEILPETELLLYMASRAQHTGQWILPALKQGKVVLCDRYYDSTIAYQGAARRLDLDLIATLTTFATYHTIPDLTFLLDLPVEQGLSRISRRQLDRLESEHLDFHERVRQQYLVIARAEVSRYIVLNGTKSPQDIHERILSTVLSRIGV